MSALPTYQIHYHGCHHKGFDGGGDDSSVGSTWVDIWGTEWHKIQEGVMGLPTGYPLTEVENLSSYSWPDPDDEHICAKLYEMAELFPDGDLFLAGSHRDTLWEKAHMLVGMENMMLCFFNEPEFAKEVLHRIMDFQLGIAEHYIKEGYTTAAVSTLLHMGGHFPRGFHYYLNPMAGYRERTQTVEADEINGFVLPWLKAHYQEDFFLFVHYWDPHVDSVWGQAEPRQRCLPPEEYVGLYYEGTPEQLDSREYIISQYDAEITYADKCIGDMLNLVDELGIADETLIVFQSDHGENLGEDHPLGELIYDHLDVHEPTIRIPLIIRYPGLEGDKAVDSLVQNVDIPPTILSYMQVEVPEVYDGQDLAPVISGTELSKYTEVYSNQGFMTCKRALVTEDGWKLIKSINNWPYDDAPTTELYDLNTDPGETENLVAAKGEWLGDLELRMARWLEEVLGNRPDPLRLRAHMGLLGSDTWPYYGITYRPNTAKRIYTATPE